MFLRSPTLADENCASESSSQSAHDDSLPRAPAHVPLAAGVDTTCRCGDTTACLRKPAGERSSSHRRWNARGWVTRHVTSGGSKRTKALSGRGLRGLGSAEGYESATTLSSRVIALRAGSYTLKLSKGYHAAWIAGTRVAGTRRAHLHARHAARCGGRADLAHAGSRRGRARCWSRPPAKQRRRGARDQLGGSRPADREAAIRVCGWSSRR